MQFLFPLFLSAVALLAIPVIIHLFYFRRYKKVKFTNVRFLREIKEESSIRSRLKNLLTLMCRILAVLFLILGFAQPFIRKDDNIKKGRKAVSVFVDNSYSMASLSADAPLMDEAKRKAEEIVQAHDLEDEFQIISHDMSARQQRLIGKEQALSMIEEIELTAEVNSLSKIQQRQHQLLDQVDHDNRVIYYVSDFQNNISDLKIEDTTYEYNLIPLHAVVEHNVSIDSAWFDAPVQMLNTANILYVKVSNWSDQPAENIQLTMRRDGAVKPIGSLNILPRSSVIDTVSISVLRPGIQKVELKITDFPVQFDDSYFLTFDVTQQIRSLVVQDNGANRYLDAAFAPDEFFEKEDQRASNLDYSTFNRFRLIVLNELRDISTGLGSALKNYLENGGNLVLFPGVQSAMESYNNFLGSVQAGRLENWDTTERTVNYFNANEFVFKDVFESARSNIRLPSTQGNFLINSTGRPLEKLLGYRDGRSYLVKYRVGRGHLYLCAAPLDDQINDLVKQAEIFLPMLYKMALSTSTNRRIAYTIGSDNIIEMENTASSAEAVYKVTGTSSFIPGQQSFGKQVILNLHDQIKDAGFYDVYLREDQPLASFAFNSNRLESDPVCQSIEYLRQQYGDRANIVGRTQLANLGQFIQEKDQGIVLWKYCLIFALIFLALEALIIRFWKA